MAKKALFKKCPSCRFSKCWDKAKVCEECGYDFSLQRKPRKTVAPVFDEDEDDDAWGLQGSMEAPAETHKVCPGCKHRCWHAAPLCEKCEWNFKTNSPKEVPKTERQKKPERPPEELLPTYFNGRGLLITVPSLGGFGKLREMEAAGLLDVPPPAPDEATYDSVMQWIREVQSHGARQNPRSEYAEQALRYLVRHGKKPPSQEGYEKICGLIRDVYANLEVGYPPEPETEPEPPSVESVKTRAKMKRKG